jgi:uncharacterized protein YjiS (DUF1127 family)
MFQSKPLGLLAMSARGFLRSLGVAVVDVLLVWIERSRSRRQILKLDARMLEDIGVSRTDAVREARKPFWRA